MQTPTDPTDPMDGKASFDDIYDRDDPRAYVRALAPLGYQAPEQARGTFRRLAATLGRQRDHAPGVLDLCCSYGTNAALLNHDVSQAELWRRYASPRSDTASAAELAAQERAFLQAHRSAEVYPTVGLDAAPRAIAYGVASGALDAGRAEDLEADEPSDALKDLLADVELITVTGGIGYITATTFDRVLGASSGAATPWVAAFVLRWVDMAPIETVLNRYGLVLERLETRTFRQRRFADDEERDHALDQLRGLGIDPDGIESDGYHHTWLHVARPAEFVERAPLHELLPA